MLLWLVVLLLPAAHSVGINRTECGATKGCFPHDAPVFAWKLLDNYHMFVEVQSPGDGNGYTAIGFSNYAHKGQDYIIECSKIGDGNLTMRFSWNTDGPANFRIRGEEDIEPTYFSNIITRVENNIVYCSATVNVGGWSGSDLVLDIHNGTEYYFKYAFGTTYDGGLVPHAATDTLASPLKVDFKSKTGGIARGPPTDTALRLKQAHAILMVLAWICFIPTALLFARFLKGSWPSSKPFGMAIWFHVHRTANLLGLTLMVASFVCIMCAMKWKWTGPGSGVKYWYRIHTMLGILALVLAWIQPFISFFRCGPQDPRRPIFNWAHRLIGISAYIFATATLGVAAYDYQSPSGVWNRSIQMVPGWKLVLVLLPIALIAALFIIFPILDWMQASKARKINKEGEKEDQKGNPNQMLKQWAVFGVMAILIADAITISVLIYDKLRPLGVNLSAAS